MSNQKLIKVLFGVKSLAESGVLSTNVYLGPGLLSTVHRAEAVKSTHSMLTDNFGKFCDCFYARISPSLFLSQAPVMRGEKQLGKKSGLSRISNTDSHGLRPAVTNEH